MGLSTTLHAPKLVIVNEIASIITKIESDYGYNAGVIEFGGVNDLSLTYLYGPEPLVVKKLKDLDPDLTYPLIALPQPFFESNEGGYKRVRFPRLIFAHKTDEALQTQERESITFAPILRPLVEAFLDTLVKSSYVVQKDTRQLQGTTAEIPGFVQIAENINTTVDVIEINDLTVTFTNSKC